MPHSDNERQAWRIYNQPEEKKKNTRVVFWRPLPDIPEALFALMRSAIHDWHPLPAPPKKGGEK